MSTNPVAQITADKRAARREAIVAEMRGGIRQRSNRIPSGRQYDRKQGKRVEA